MNRHFSDTGVRKYNSSGLAEPSLVKKVGTTSTLKESYTVYAVQAKTDTTLDVACAFAPGFDGDANILNDTIPAGTTLFARFSRFVVSAGEGWISLE